MPFPSFPDTCSILESWPWDHDSRRSIPAHSLAVAQGRVGSVSFLTLMAEAQISQHQRYEKELPHPLTVFSF